MMTIQTRYLGPTNYKGSRIKAWMPANGASVTISYPHELSGSAVHEAAVVALLRKWLKSPQNVVGYVNASIATPALELDARGYVFGVDLWSFRQRPMPATGYGVAFPELAEAI